MMPTTPSTPHSSSSDSSTSTLRGPSPLNPSFSSPPASKSHPFPGMETVHSGWSSSSQKLPPEPTLSRPESPRLDQGSSSGRDRVSSITTIRPESVPRITTVQSLTRVSSTPAPETTSSALGLGLESTTSSSTYRGRTNSFGNRSRGRSPSGGRSRSPLRDFKWRVMRDESPDNSGTATPPNGEPVTWWDSKLPPIRPWNGKKDGAIPPEQLEGWHAARQKVAKAAANILGTASDVAHEALILSSDLLQFAPVAGLSEAARVLLNIWDALQMVDLNRSACLRLTDRCATILFSIREEIFDAGDNVGDELRDPIVRLVEAFNKVHRLLLKQGHRPFIKRYLKRDEIQVQIQVCDTALGDALGMFSLSIQIRILKQVLEAEKQRQADTSAILEHVLGDRDGPHREVLASEPIRALPEHEQAILEDLQIGVDLSSLPQLSSAQKSGTQSTSSSQKSATTPLDVLHSIHARQNRRDNTLDTAELRALMRNALQTNSDAEMIKVLQVGRDEMPEAIKTLQRALERVIEKGSKEFALEADTEQVRAEVGVDGVDSQGKGKGKESEPLIRSGTVESTESAGSTSTKTTTTSSKSHSRASRDTLDREFIESGIDSLRRLSTTLPLPSAHDLNPLSLPSWTITRYEVDREEKIGIGFFSDVYRGRYQGREVAIKVLAKTTPRSLFVREVEIWKKLKHENVLELLGASSTVGDPPWFLVSTYCSNGNLVEFLRRGRSKRSKGGHEGGVLRVGGEVDLLRIIHEIAKGMGYLHSKKVWHGDLKGTNVLINDRFHCVISDFGQSEIKSEVYRISGKSHRHGTLRWQAPELMIGLSDLTPAVDVYAFAICCVEVMTNGGLPWPHHDDDAVRHFVLKEHMRPDLPLNRIWSPRLKEIVNVCWDQDPVNRPPFTEIESRIQALRSTYGEEKESPKPPSVHLTPTTETASGQTSPDMRPVPLPNLPPDTTATMISTSLSDETFETTQGGLSPDPSKPNVYIEDDANADPRDPDSPVQEHHSPLQMRSRSSTVFSSTETSREASVAGDHFHLGYESPVPIDEHVADVKNERRYRMLLQHEFHPSLILPLWSPCLVGLGAVGYHRKPEGDFVTLFNALRPHEATLGTFNIPSLYGYGRVTRGNQVVAKRNLAQRAIDVIQSWVGGRSKSSSPPHVNRKYSTPLRSGHKMAHLVVESTVYNYVEDLAAPKAWFKANINLILKLYGKSHGLQKEDILLVIGTLEASDYALYVSHNHPDSQLDFNVFSSPQVLQPWGHFSTSSAVTETSSFLGGNAHGPVYEEDNPGSVHSSKVSIVQKNRKKADAVLLARLRFQPDHADPTSR